MNLLQFAIAQNQPDLPFVPAPRVYKGCMGRIVPGLPEGPVYPGAYRENPEMVFLWLLQEFSDASQTRILQFFKDAGDEDLLLSWTDFIEHDPSPDAFGDLILRVRAAGFRPTVFLVAKEDGIRDLAGLQAFVAPVLPVLRACGVPRVCVGWELNFIPPGSVKTTPPDPGVIQPFIDWLAPQVKPADLYVHFVGGCGSWQQDGLFFADFWNVNVNKLRGVLHQKITDQSVADYQTGEGGLRDILLHFNGGSGCTADSGDGTPFDLIAFEVNLELLSVNRISEDEMHARARAGVATDPTTGPTGVVRVMGSGCGGF